MSAHASPAEIRANLSHPIVDGDGHWLEYAAVFSEKIRKAGGDKGPTGSSPPSNRRPTPSS